MLVYRVESVACRKERVVRWRESLEKSREECGEFQKSAQWKSKRKMAKKKDRKKKKERENLSEKVARGKAPECKGANGDTSDRLPGKPGGQQWRRGSGRRGRKRCHADGCRE